MKLPRFSFNKVFKRIGGFLTVIALAALTTESGWAVGEPSSRGTLRFGWHAKPAPFHPFKTTDTITMPLMELVFNRLLRYDANGEFIPDLAERWEISDDGLTYTFYLRRGVKFHDGHEFTADDALKTFEWLANKEISAEYASYYDEVAAWEKLSDHVFQARLKKVYSPFLVNIWRAWVVPSHLLPDSAALENFSENPVGTGPFRFAGRTEAGEMHFSANPDYFEGRPCLEGVNVRIFKDKTQVWAAFLRGELDVLFYLEQNDYEAVRGNPSFQTHRALSSRNYSLIFNLEGTPFTDRRVRQAVARGIRRSELIEKVEKGDGVPASGPFYPGSWAYNSGVPPKDYDPESARKLLAEAGFNETTPLSFTLLADARNERFMLMAKIIRQNLQEIGVRAQIELFSSQEELSRRVYKNRDFQAYLTSLNADFSPNGVSVYWESGSSFNVGGYKNPEVDRLLGEGRRYFQKNRRAESYKKVHEILEEDAPAVFLYYPYVFHAAARGIAHFEDLALNFIPFYLLKDVCKEAQTGERR